MSGGSYNYMYYRIEDEYCDKMHDAELNEIIQDLVEVLHDVEWWQSADICEKDYRRTVDKFKRKWFRRRKVDVQKFIEGEFEKKKEELIQSLSYLSE